jgi:hypothetical protein
LHVRDHRSQSSADEGDGLVPCGQIRGKQQAAHERQDARTRRPIIASPRREPQGGQCWNRIHRAIEHGGHRRDIREPDEDRRERDAEHAEQGDEVDHATTAAGLAASWTRIAAPTRCSDFQDVENAEGRVQLSECSS